MMKIDVRKYIRRLNMHIMPVLVWLLAVITIVGLFQQRAQRFEVVGIAQSNSVNVASTCDGRLKSMPVQLFEEVKKGQILAVIDTVLDNEQLKAELQAEQNILLADIDRLTVELNSAHRVYEANIQDRRSDWIAQNRTFTADIVNAKLNVLTIEASLKPDQIRLENLKLNNKIYLSQDNRINTNAIPYELKKIRLEYDELAKKVESNQQLLDQAKIELGQAEQRRKEYHANYSEFASTDEQAEEVVLKSVNVLEKKIDRLWVQREDLVLRAPFDGIVRQLAGKTGEAVSAGTPILTLAETTPSEILAYADQSPSNQIAEAMEVELVRNSDPPQIARSHVIHLGPAIEQLPNRLWRNPNVPQWGRPFLVEIPAGMELIPGELVGIRKL
jgi:multidrug resistance efflux pump